MKKMPCGARKKKIMKVTIEITLISLKHAGKKVKRTGAIISIALALVSGSYLASDRAQLPHVVISWQQEG